MPRAHCACFGSHPPCALGFQNEHSRALAKLSAQLETVVDACVGLLLHAHLAMQQIRLPIGSGCTTQRRRSKKESVRSQTFSAERTERSQAIPSDQPKPVLGTPTRTQNEENASNAPALNDQRQAVRRSAFVEAKRVLTDHVRVLDHLELWSHAQKVSGPVLLGVPSQLCRYDRAGHGSSVLFTLWTSIIQLALALWQIHGCADVTGLTSGSFLRSYALCVCLMCMCTCA